MEHVAEHTRQGRAISAGQMAGKNAVSCKRLQPKLTVNTPGDAFEQQADAVAARVVQPAVQPALMRSTKSVAPALMRATTNVAPTVMRKCAKCEQEEKLQRKESEQEAPMALRQVEVDLKHSQGEGRPLPAHLNALMSRRIGADFSAVRIHTGVRAHGMNKVVKAKAFAYGKDIYFREGQYDPDSTAGQFLLAHELTHVVQQGHAPLLNIDAAGTAGAAAGKTATPAGKAGTLAHTGDKAIHRFSLEDAKGYLSDLNPLDFSIEDLVKKFMPGIVLEIKQAGGILPWLEKKVTAGLDKLLNAVVGPVKDAVNFVSNLSPTMAKIITWIQGAGAKIAKNDCSSFSELGEMVEKFVDELTAPAIEKIKELASTASAWCKDLWQQFGLPVWDFIKKYLGDQWDAIKSLGSLIWEKSKPIRDWLAKAWVAFKNWLGIGDGPEGENGILQWVEAKVLSVWDTIKAKIEPFKTQLMVIGGVMVMLSPAGPLIAAGAAFTVLISAINWYRKNIHSPADIVKLRVKFEKEILPAILQGINKATAFLKPLFGGLIEKFNSVAGSLGKLVGLAAGSIISFIQSALQWISDGFNRLLTWATEGLASLSNWLEGIFQKVRVFVIPIIQFLEKVATVVDDIMQLPLLIAGAVWKKVPACIRLAVEDFLLNSVLKNVPYFEDVVTFVKYWQKIKAGVIDVVKTVFVTGDLKGAILKAFKLLLDVLGIPVQLVTGIYEKAVASWETIVNKPKVIFANIVQSIKNGFTNFSKNFLKNAIDALGNWIFSKVKGVKMPKEFTLQSVFGLVLDILGFTEDNIFKHIEQKTSKDFAKNLRMAYNAGKSLVKWVIEIFKDPKAAYEKMKDKAKEMKSKLFESIGKWIATSVIGVFVAKITAELATTPFGEAVEAIIDVYKMVKTAVEYLERILRIVDGVLDSVLELAGGKLDKATATVEKGLVLGLEVAVAFIAKVLGIGDVPQQVKKIVEEDIRPIVDKGIDAVIDLVIKAVQAVGGALGLGGKKEGDKEGDQQEDGVLSEEHFTMNGADHKITIELKSKKVSLLMASANADVLIWKCDKVLDKLQEKIGAAGTFGSQKYGKNYEFIVKSLKDVQSEAKEIPSTVQNDLEKSIKAKRLGGNEGLRKFKEHSEIEMVSKLIKKLKILGDNYKVTELEEFTKKPPPVRNLITPKDGRGIRGTIYDKYLKWGSLRDRFLSLSKAKDAFIIKLRTMIDNKDDSGWKEYQRTYRVDEKEKWQTFNPEGHEEYEVDHEYPVVCHWNKGFNGPAGKDTDDATREDFLGLHGNLRVTTKLANRKKGREVDGKNTYDTWVGPGFKSKLLDRGGNRSGKIKQYIMENKKTKPTITAKPSGEKGGKHAEGLAHDEERAALVRSSQMPSFMQRKTVATDEEEKKEKEARIARMHAAAGKGPEKKR